MRPLCIYHGNCADGFTAAWAVWRRFGDEFEYFAGFYGAEPPDVTGRDVVLVDFSYKRPVLVEMARNARSVLVLDHHKTAAEDLADFPPPICGNDWDAHLGDMRGEAGHPVDPNLPRVVFDMERSGAAIAWDFFHLAPGGIDAVPPRPRLVEYVQDRDLWRFYLEGSREVSAFIFSHEYSFPTWDLIASDLESDLCGAINQGAAIERKHHKDIAELAAKGARMRVIAGLDVPVLNVPYTLSSDAGHLLGKGEPFAACYWDNATHRVFSLRSAEDGEDVSAVAAKFGGGGHKHAAGFQILLEEFDWRGLE